MAYGIRVLHSTADHTPTSPKYRKPSIYILSLFIWWFAVIDRTGEIFFSQHRSQQGCNTTRNVYTRVPFLTITSCTYSPDKQRMEDVG